MVAHSIRWIQPMPSTQPSPTEQTGRRPRAIRTIAGSVAFTLLLALLSLGLVAPAEAAGRRGPTSVAVVAGSVKTTSVMLGWNRQNAATGRFQVQAATHRNHTAAKVKMVRAKARTHAHHRQRTTVTGLRPGKTYYLRVRSYAHGHASKWSRTVRVTTRPAAVKHVTTDHQASPVQSTRPAAITSVRSNPGPGVGELTISWASTRTNTSYFRIDTGLTLFSTASPTLPVRGRDATSFYVPGNQTSTVLTAQQMAEAGAPVGSANHLYFRVYAVNDATGEPQERAYPFLQAATSAPAEATGSVPIRVASYNVRTIVKTDVGTRSWKVRAPYVAKTIMSRQPGIIALQELSPGGIDGTSSSPRQTDDLMARLSAAGGNYYQMVRATSYVQGGTTTGSQGTRIVYDQRRYLLLSECTDRSRLNDIVFGFSPSCTISLPLRPGDSEAYRRHAAYAEFEDRSTGARFWFVSAHLEHRTSTDPVERDSLEALRGEQAAAIDAQVSEMNPDGLPVIIAGDLNTWQNTPATYAPHNLLVDDGYYDTAAATSRVNLNYPTFNNFASILAPTNLGFGARLDAIMVKGSVGASRFENVMRASDPIRGSDHNMVVADFRLPRQ